MELEGKDRIALDELTNLIMDNYDVYDLDKIQDDYIRDTIDMMMRNWKSIMPFYKIHRIYKTINLIKEDKSL